MTVRRLSKCSDDWRAARSLGENDFLKRNLIYFFWFCGKIFKFLIIFYLKFSFQITGPAPPQRPPFRRRRRGRGRRGPWGRPGGNWNLIKIIFMIGGKMKIWWEIFFLNLNLWHKCKKEILNLKSAKNQTTKKNPKSQFQKNPKDFKCPSEKLQKSTQKTLFLCKKSQIQINPPTSSSPIPSASSALRGTPSMMSSPATSGLYLGKILILKIFFNFFQHFSTKKIKI